MNLREKIGQTLMIGMEGTTPSKELLEFIEQRQPGGVILFSRNLTSPTQVARLTNALQAAARLPMIIAIDQEGGRVSRLPKGFTLFPSAATIGARASANIAYRAAEITALELRAVGINMNMAPVLDVDTNPKNPVIGDRAFGHAITVVSAMGLATTVGLQDNRVIACGKHFPGHGDTHEDSHQALPHVNQSLKRLLEVELAPFAHVIENRIAALMTAHVLYPALDPKDPATLSRPIITGLLRTQMRFKGLVVSDDLLMAAIGERLGPGPAAVRTLEAGVDMALFSRGPECGEAAYIEIEKALKTGHLTEDRLDQAVLHILSAKEPFILPFEPVDLKAVKGIVGAAAHRRFLEELGGATAPPVRRT